MNAVKVLLGVLVGLAAGTFLGVMFAPDKGFDTRRKIGEKKDEIKDELKEKFNEFLDKLSERFEMAKEGVNDYTQKAQSKIEDVKMQ